AGFVERELRRQRATRLIVLVGQRRVVGGEAVAKPRLHIDRGWIERIGQRRSKLICCTVKAADQRGVRSDVGDVVFGAETVGPDITGLIVNGYQNRSIIVREVVRKLDGTVNRIG